MNIERDILLLEIHIHVLLLLDQQARRPWQSSAPHLVVMAHPSSLPPRYSGKGITSHHPLQATSPDNTVDYQKVRD